MMVEEKKVPKVLNLTLNDSFIDKIVGELNVMKENNNKIVKITSASKEIVLVINHVNNDLKKKKKE